MRSLRMAVALVAAAVVTAGSAQTSTVTIWDGVFTAEQATRGRVAYTGPCDRCHGFKLDGAADDPDMLPAPPIAGAKFLRKWDGRPMAALFEYTRATMPSNNPGYLADNEVADILAFMLASSGAPAGAVELTSDTRALANIAIESRR
jgi:mono/diheme cytochrome c family protein